MEQSLYARMLLLRRAAPEGYHSSRALAELDYAVELAKYHDPSIAGEVAGGVACLERLLSDEGAIGAAGVKTLEALMPRTKAIAKNLTVLCVSHAHIDMNWMWRYDETVSITLDTFRTVLNLMDEYPHFTFSQSQASVYRIVEEFAPEMLPAIRQRVREGRWEVTASSWVENDKNMPNGESMARHLLYTRKYLSELFGLPKEKFTLDFEPDTFGHSRNLPEILQSGGVKYYYHCRAHEGDILYRWRAPSGEELLVYCEPVWYLGEVKYDAARRLPYIANKYGMDRMLMLYGAGDHGGGPTRRDIERILDMNSWPIAPNFKFSSYAEFFAACEDVRASLPVIDHELNFVFTGCYTTQTRIKTANRIGEETLKESELYCAAAKLLCGAPYKTAAFEEGWRNILFNQFHDIVTGSGVAGTRERAMGQFQQTLALANTRKMMALRAIADQIDYSPLISGEDIRQSVSEGAGVGYGVENFQIAQVGRGAGMKRVFTVFNPSSTARDEVVELLVWDWPGQAKYAHCYGERGEELPCQPLDQGAHEYWQHRYLRILVKVFVPAFGYATVTLDEVPAPSAKDGFITDHRLHRADEFVLENEFVKARLDVQTGAIASFIDKQTGREMVRGPSGYFRFIKEDTRDGMTSWIVGRYIKAEMLGENLHIKWAAKGALRNAVRISAKFSASTLNYTICLDAGSRALHFEAEADWQEHGAPDSFIPQLNFTLPVAYKASAYRYNIPMGVIDRDGMALDVPANSFGLPLPDEGAGLMLFARTKYGFRGEDDAICLTLIRSSYDPDPHPELGRHQFSFDVALCPRTDAASLLAAAEALNEPMTPLSVAAKAGKLPMTAGLCTIQEGKIALSAIKLDEETASALILRGYEVSGQDGTAKLSFALPVKSVQIVDTHENPVEGGTLSVQGRTVSIPVKKYSVFSVKLGF